MVSTTHRFAAKDPWLIFAIPTAHHGPNDAMHRGSGRKRRGKKNVNVSEADMTTGKGDDYRHEQKGFMPRWVVK